ncbi:MAG: hypothetical protein JNK05_40220 [Myxococcales bacterium]|nr:hypothetical protein [Myxococcales bacterium]
MASPGRRYSIVVDRVVDACAGHDRQAVRALAFDRRRALVGVLGHDPVLWHEAAPGRVAALCELEADASFDPTAVLFSRDCSLIVAGHPGQVRAYEVSSGALLWERDCPWWELFELDLDSIVCVEYQPRRSAAYAVIELRSGVERSRREIEPLATPTATVERGSVRVFEVRNIIADRRPGSLVSAARQEVPAFSIDPCAHARLWPKKIAGGELFLALSYGGEIIQAFASLNGGRSWTPKSRLVALGSMKNGAVIVAARDSIPATLVLLNGSTGSELASFRLPTEQAEAIVCATLDDDSTLALGTSLGRAIVLSITSEPDT